MRRTLAFSIHELAVILGEDITHRDLVPVFDGFLKDLDEVRIGILRHLADFLRVSSCFAIFLKDLDEVRIGILRHIADFLRVSE